MAGKSLWNSLFIVYILFSLKALCRPRLMRTGRSPPPPTCRLNPCASRTSPIIRLPPLLEKHGRPPRPPHPMPWQIGRRLSSIPTVITTGKSIAPRATALRKPALPTTVQSMLTSLNSGCTKVVFTSNRDGDYEIFSINPDGTGLLQLTRTHQFMMSTRPGRRTARRSPSRPTAMGSMDLYHEPRRNWFGAPDDRCRI